MRNNNWNLVWGILGVLIIAIGFSKGNTTERIFGFDINVWLYRGVWAAVSISSFLSYFKRKKEESGS